MKSKKIRTVLKTVGCIAVAAAVGMGVFRGYVRVQSQKYNLITLDTSEIPEPIQGASYEGDVQLSEVKMHYAVYGERGHPLILVHGNGDTCRAVTRSRPPAAFAGSRATRAHHSPSSGHAIAAASYAATFTTSQAVRSPSTRSIS